MLFSGYGPLWSICPINRQWKTRRLVSGKYQTATPQSAWVCLWSSHERHNSSIWKKKTFHLGESAFRYIQIGEQWLLNSAIPQNWHVFYFLRIYCQLMMSVLPWKTNRHMHRCYLDVLIVWRIRGTVCFIAQKLENSCPTKDAKRLKVNAFDRRAAQIYCTGGKHYGASTGKNMKGYHGLAGRLNQSTDDGNNLGDCKSNICFKDRCWADVAEPARFRIL